MTKAESNFTIGKAKALIVITLILMALAALSAFFLPRGSQLERCRDILSLQSRYECLSNLANSTSNSSICSLIPQQYSGACYSGIAEATLNASICTNAAGYASECIGYVANATKSYAACNLLGVDGSQGCIAKVAIASDNITACRSIDNASVESACASIINLKLAKATLDPSYCANVSETENQSMESTMLSQANYSSGIFGIPETYTFAAEYLGSSLRDICYYDVAYGSSNQSACGYISNSTLSDLCSSSINNLTSPAASTFNGTINYTALNKYCMQEPAPYYQGCLNAVSISKAVVEKNISICGSQNSTFEYNCYAAVAQAYHNTTYCSYITNATASSICIGDVEYNLSAS